MTALMRAVREGHLDVVKRLLDYKQINVNVQDHADVFVKSVTSTTIILSVLFPRYHFCFWSWSTEQKNK